LKRFFVNEATVARIVLREEEIARSTFAIKVDAPIAAKKVSASQLWSCVNERLTEKAAYAGPVLRSSVAEGESCNVRGRDYEILARTVRVRKIKRL